MSVPDAAVSFLLENLSQALQYNYGLIANARGNVQSLQAELKKLKDLMEDFSQYNDDSQYVRGVVKEMRSIVFEAEDAVDTFLLRAGVQKARKWLDKYYHKITDYPKQLLEVGNQMENISQRIKSINEGPIDKGLKLLEFQALNNHRPQTSSKQAPKVEEEHVVGFEGAAETVQKLLTQGAEGFEVISIVGMLGLGKTTLARKVFKDPHVDYEFMIRAFVYVSKEYTKREVLLKVLESFTQPSELVNNMGDEALEKHVYQQLEGKQYLIVLDDVWERKDWDEFKDAFPKNKKRCRVLITTRHDQVARYANPRTDPYKLEFLSHDKSRELLSWRVFNEDKCPSEFQTHEITIATKCKGLPLAIVVIAGVIVNHPDRVEWWRHVANSVGDYITYKDTEETNKVIELMNIMYKHLPNKLKPCFLYLGVFREDFEIPVWKLLRLWIAEGLIQQESNFNIEDLAEKYLEELVYRNLVMVGQRRSNGKIKTCRMHDTLREFCRNEANEENLFQEIKRDNVDYFLSGDVTLEMHRRLCINVNVLAYISGKPSGMRVRSFLTFAKEETKVVPKFVPYIPTSFKLLRVLETESLIFTRFPVDLSNLILLKYIAISSNFECLPSSLSGLWNLQTLIIKTTSPTLDIKVDIWKLPQFRHLHTNASTNLPPPSDGIDRKGGRKVQTLSTISPKSCTGEVFQRTPEVKKLGIRGDITKLFPGTSESNLFGYLRTLNLLENLKLLNEETNSQLYNLPSEKSFPKQLTKLTLLNTFLDWKEMSVLGKLENLEVLKLKDYAFQGNSWETEKGGFLRLKHLHIGRTDLVVWEASVDHFPQLRTLKLIGCDKLAAFPHGLGADISNLQSVVLYSTNPNVASTARRLHVLKLEQEKMSNKISSFKLFIYPPDQ